VFDLSDQPVQMTLVVGAEEADRLFAYRVQEHAAVFYAKLAVEFGTLGKA
jgi:hypothetical protein